MLGGKWRLLLIRQLATGPKRPSALRRLIPEISEKMLAQELRFLLESDLIAREDYDELPPRVEYSLTQRGRLALPILRAMKEFADAYEAHEAD